MIPDWAEFAAGFGLVAIISFVAGMVFQMARDAAREEGGR